MNTHVAATKGAHNFRLSQSICALFMLSIFIDVPLFTFTSSKYLSHLDVYRALRPGMSRTDALQILEQDKIGCWRSFPKDAAPQECKFVDFWREYTVTFSATESSRVVMKYYSYRRRFFH
jgi:hypothetical protein